MIRRDYLAFGDGRQTHFLRAGAGDPLILLHPSPLSSSWMEPVIGVLSDAVDAVAPDTPGYGASDPLPGPSAGPGSNDQHSGPADGLSDYTHWLLEFVRTLGFESVGLYGSATGAQIAIEFARAYPEAARFAVVDNVAHFTAEERERMPARYFPDLSPRADGSHLVAAWSMVRGLWQWFPWYRQDEEHRIAEPAAISDGMLQRMLVDHLRAGPDYARAYRAAMRNEEAARVQGLAVPVRIIRWQGGLLRRYADRLDDFDWPAHIRMAPCGAAPEERLAAIRRAVIELNGLTVGAEAPATDSAPR